MINCGSSFSDFDWKKKRRNLLQRRLAFLTFLKDSYERKLAGINASIDKLEDQLASTDISNS